MSQEKPEFRCGTVAIIGRPNVGKSTLLNCLIGQKLSITSPKPQTTRHQILGIKTTEDAQCIFIDTPGVHRENKKALHHYMNQQALNALDGVDVVLFVVEATRWTEEDEQILEQINAVKTPVLLVINKVDKLEDKARLLPTLHSLGERRAWDALVPVSAYTKHNITALLDEIKKELPVADAQFDAEWVTDKPVRFLAAEIVREKLMRVLEDEVPYALTVDIEAFEENEEGAEISALILVERKGQKAIVIGKKGETLKEIGRQARIDMCQLLQKRVHLNLWVKVKSGWSDDPRILPGLGYSDGT